MQELLALQESYYYYQVRSYCSKRRVVELPLHTQLLELAVSLWIKIALFVRLFLCVQPCAKILPALNMLFRNPIVAFSFLEFY